MKRRGDFGCYESDNPLIVDPATINQIQVLETIKEGKTVWVRN